MDIQELQKTETKSVTISVRTFPKCSQWMKDRNVSPTKVFNKALENLMKDNPLTKK